MCQDLLLFFDLIFDRSSFCNTRIYYSFILCYWRSSSYRNVQFWNVLLCISSRSHDLYQPSSYQKSSLCSNCQEQRLHMDDWGASNVVRNPMLSSYVIQDCQCTVANRSRAVGSEAPVTSSSDANDTWWEIFKNPNPAFGRFQRRLNEHLGTSREWRGTTWLAIDSLKHILSSPKFDFNLMLELMIVISSRGL